MKLSSVLRASALVLLFHALPAWAASVSWLPLQNTSAERVSEPVFGGTMMVYEAGNQNAEPVVLIHGVGDGGARDWRELIVDLARDYRVIAVDLPGFAGSSKGNHLYAPDQLALAVQGALEGRVNQPFSLIGHSLGAAVSMAYAHLYPEQINRLILANMPGVLHRTVYSRFMADQGAAWLDSFSPMGGGSLVSALLASQLEQLELKGFNPSMLLYSPVARQQFLGGDPKLIAAYAAVEHDFSSALRDLRVPTLVVWGENDPLTPLRIGQIVAASIPGARLQLLPGAGHMPLQQTPETFIAAVRAELSGRFAGLPPYALTAKKPVSDRDETCKNQTNNVYTGNLRSLKLINCDNVVIEDANIGELDIIGGGAHMINSHVFRGASVSGASLKLTAGSITGEPPLTLSGSDIDAAGTRFISEYDIARNRGSQPVSLAFSVAAHENPVGSRRVFHEILRLPGGSVWP